jgi:hypothetical protein
MRAFCATARRVYTYLTASLLGRFQSKSKVKESLRPKNRRLSIFFGGESKGLFPIIHDWAGLRVRGVHLADSSPT